MTPWLPSGFHVSNPPTALSAHAAVITFDDWLEGDACRSLQFCRSSPGLSAYLSLSTRVAAAARALFRFGRFRHDVRLFKCKLVASPVCRRCPGYHESTAHVLRECPRFAAARAVCKAAFLKLRLTFTCRMILGCDSLAPCLRSRQSRCCIRCVPATCCCWALGPLTSPTDNRFCHDP